MMSFRTARLGDDLRAHKITKDDIPPEERDNVQEYLLRLWLLKVDAKTARRRDPVVRHY